MAGAPPGERLIIEPPPPTSCDRPALLWPLARLSLNLALIALGAVLLLRGFTELRLVVVPVLIALLLSSLLVPVADLLRRRLPSAVATLLSMAAGAAVLVGLLALVVPAMVDEFDQVGQAAQDGLDEALRWLAEGPLDVSETQVQDGVQRAIDGIRGSGALSGGLIGGATLAAELVTGAALVLVLLFFFVHDGRAIFGWAVRQFPPARRPQVQEIGERVWDVVSGYVRGVAVIALADALLIGLALVLIGVPLVIPLMVLTFLGAFVPLVGAVLAGAVAALVALVTGGVVDAVLVAVAVTVVQQVEGDLLYPLVVGQAISLHPVAILLALTAGTLIAGVIGTLLAVPLTAGAWAAVTVLRPPEDMEPAAADG
ncbi:MAG: AI-2E family transporter [Solirubrobacterales bacterium]|nr:AI-2E family transporter [Solirubrobacterales bacterium]